MSVMRIAFECPTDLLDRVQPLADFDFTLAHLVLKDSEYRSHYLRTKRDLVLDNSTNELSRPVSFSTLKEAAYYLYPKYIIPPDYLKDSKRTMEAYLEAESIFGSSMLLPVVQGSSLEEVIECANFYWTVGKKYICLPYDILSSRSDKALSMTSNRVKVLEKLKSLHPFEFHLLGMTTLKELSLSIVKESVASLDTGLPILFGKEGKYFGTNDVEVKNGVTLDGFKDSNYDMETIYRNIAYLRRVVNG